MEMRDFRTRQKLGKGQHSSLMRNKTHGGSIESNQTRFIWNVDNIIMADFNLIILF